MSIHLLSQAVTAGHSGGVSSVTAESGPVGLAGVLRRRGGREEVVVMLAVTLLGQSSWGWDFGRCW